MGESGVYRIDLGNGWFYVGSSNNLARREVEHRRGLVSGTHYNRVAQNVFNKYGEFSFTILGLYPVSQIIEREQELLDAYHSDPKCANIALGAGRSMAGRKFTAEHRARISAALKGVKRTPEQCDAQRLRRHSPESLKKIGDASRGRGAGVKKSPAHRAAIAAALTGNKHTPERRANMVAAWVTRRSKTNAAPSALVVETD